jgi:hypothetical protein
MASTGTVGDATSKQPGIFWRRRHRLAVAVATSSSPGGPSVSGRIVSGQGGGHWAVDLVITLAAIAAQTVRVLPPWRRYGRPGVNLSPTQRNGLLPPQHGPTYENRGERRPVGSSVTAPLSMNNRRDRGGLRHGMIQGRHRCAKTSSSNRLSSPVRTNPHRSGVNQTGGNPFRAKICCERILQIPQLAAELCLDSAPLVPLFEIGPS